jgi:ABC-type branched-subunit amino acid transport system ATPase component
LGERTEGFFCAEGLQRKGFRMVKKLTQRCRSIGSCRCEATKSLQNLKEVELAAAFGGDPRLLWIDEPDLKSERVQDS